MIIVMIWIVSAALCSPSAALSPPAPPEPTTAEIVQNAQAIFTGRVAATIWKPILPDFPNAGTIELNVKVTKVLLGDTRVIRNRIIYGAGRVSMTEVQAMERFNGKSFVFVGEMNQSRTGEVEIALPPSGKPPFELSMIGEFKREIAKQNGLFLKETP